nr:hypothetical protein [Tanacetum cinerariifolium]
MKHVESMSLFVNLVKQQQSTSKPLRLFGLHVGVNQVSLAVSELISKPASPYCVMVRRGNNIADRIQELIRQDSVAALIVGVPSDAGQRHPENNPDNYLNTVRRGVHYSSGEVKWWCGLWLAAKVKTAAAAVSAGVAAAAAMVGTPRGELAAVDMWCGGGVGGDEVAAGGSEVVIAVGGG